jgi:hypothetical protein
VSGTAKTGSAEPHVANPRDEASDKHEAEAIARQAEAVLAAAQLVRHADKHEHERQLIVERRLGYAEGRLDATVETLRAQMAAQLTASERHHGEHMQRLDAHGTDTRRTGAGLIALASTTLATLLLRMFGMLGI